MSSPPRTESKMEEIRRQVNRLLDEVGRLADQDIPPANFFAELLPRAINGIAAPAGAVWLRSPQGHLVLQFQVNLRLVGLENDESARQQHDELLRKTCLQAEPISQPPYSGEGQGSASGPGNPTGYAILLVPILLDRQVVGLVEVFQDPRHNPEAVPGFLQYLMRMASHASDYLRNQQLRQMIGQQQVWTQLEAFARQIHASLNPTEVAYIVANEGRRLVGCDRLAVVIRQAKKGHVEAVSGCEVVERRSNEIQLMQALGDAVSLWGEKLVFRGTKEEGLPAPVLEALDNYLAARPSKVLVILPLKDEREGEQKKPARSTLVMEAFEPNVAPEQLLARLEVVGRHATTALYNSVEHRRIPMRWIWMPLAKLEEGLGGRARTIAYLVGGALLTLLLILLLAPYPLKMDATGQLLPEERVWIYSPVPARVVQFGQDVQPSSQVQENQSLVLMHDVSLEMKFRELQAKIDGLTAEINTLTQQLTNTQNPADRPGLEREKIVREGEMERNKAELTILRQRVNAVPGQPGYFWVKSPIGGHVLNENFRENLTNRTVKPSDQLVRIGNKAGVWEIELKIPQRHIGQIKQAFDPNNPAQELDVDLLLRSAPTRTFKGKLSRDRIAAEATPDQNAVGESEPVVQAWVRIDSMDIPEDSRIPDSLKVAGTEVHAKVRCGNRRMIYSLFYGVWEFFYEKVVFFF